MSAFLKKISCFVFLFILSFSADSHEPTSHPTICPYGHSSICQTYSGNFCSLFVPYYQQTWFSSCLTNGFLHFCLNVPSLPVPIVQNICYLRGTPCICTFGFVNGSYIYDPGIIL